jgi:hypothetical protein
MLVDDIIELFTILSKVKNNKPYVDTVMPHAVQTLTKYHGHLKANCYSEAAKLVESDVLGRMLVVLGKGFLYQEAMQIEAEKCFVMLMEILSIPS